MHTFRHRYTLHIFNGYLKQLAVDEVHLALLFLDKRATGPLIMWFTKKDKIAGACALLSLPLHVTKLLVHFMMIINSLHNELPRPL